MSHQSINCWLDVCRSSFAANSVSFLAVLASLVLMRPSEFFPVGRRKLPTFFRDRVCLPSATSCPAYQDSTGQRETRHREVRLTMRWMWQISSRLLVLAGSLALSLLNLATASQRVECGSESDEPRLSITGHVEKAPARSFQTGTSTPYTGATLLPPIAV